MAVIVFGEYVYACIIGGDNRFNFSEMAISSLLLAQKW